MVKFLESGSLRERGEKYWLYVFSLDGSLAHDCVVRTRSVLEPWAKESFRRIVPDEVGQVGEIGNGFLLAQKRLDGVWIALGYIGWDRRPVFCGCALNGVISGFDPPRNWLVLYGRDIQWLLGLRDKKAERMREIEHRSRCEELGRERERGEAINGALLARRRADSFRKKKREETLANLRAIQTTLKLERILEPVWGFKFKQKISSLERRLAALEARQA